MQHKPVELHKLNILNSVKETLEFFKLAQINNKYIALGIVLAVILFLINLYSISLLFPLANSLITKDFTTLTTQPGLSEIIKSNQALFGSQLAVFILFGFWLYGTILVKSGVKYALFICTNEQAKIASLKIRERVFSRYLEFGKKFFDKTSTGQLNNLLLNSSRGLQGQLDLINNIIVEIISLIVSLSLMLSISWQLTLLVFMIVPLNVIFTNKAKKKITTLSEEHAQAQKNFTEKIMDILNCMPIVKGFSQEEKEKKTFEEVNSIEVKKDTELQRKIELFNPIQEIIFTTTTLIVAGAMGFMTIADPTITPANAIVFLYLLPRINPSVSNISTFDAKLASISPQTKMLKDIFDDSNKHIIKGGDKEFKTLNSKIEFKDLNFSYEAEKPVLKGVTFTINKGDHVALIGPSGVGKTTIANLLLRFYDCPKNSIFIDGNDIKEYSVSSLKSKMAFVSQDIMLFNDTIEANIIYSNPSISRERLSEIIEMTHLSETIKNMPQKEKTIIGEKGATVSGGEKQRIALARALARNAEIIVLDEPTSALDPKTELIVSQVLNKELKDKTILVIAHRPAIIKNVDRIVILERGKTVQDDLREELQRKGILKEYFG